MSEHGRRHVRENNVERRADAFYGSERGQTFSGAEEFTYDMQTQKRAIIVGETTGGGAHPVDGMPAGDHFTIGVPLERPINPITKKDWEGTGITPDVKVPAADDLDERRIIAVPAMQEPLRPDIGVGLGWSIGHAVTISHPQYFAPQSSSVSSFAVLCKAVLPALRIRAA